MHLKSISLKGFKSFPDRTKLDFGSGVSVIIGPNGSGKSNITDGVLWALGEQSPTAVRGQNMQDLIFAGGHGIKGRNLAEVEVVIDNSDGLLASEFSEISIARFLDRSGEAGYRLNGARCRLIDVTEVLSDTGLGKEMHSVISQGKVEQIVMSKPHDRTALIEEAAGLSKHRKRRHRAQLKLNRTQDNLDRALDVEREARTRLRPLKRQAEAAELHARIERQSLELRSQLTADQLRLVRAELAEAEAAAAAARGERDGFEQKLTDAAREREQVERSFAEHGQARERLSDHLFAARSATERISIRLESARERLRATTARLERSQRAVASFPGSDQDQAEDFRGRLGELEAELGRIDAERNARLEVELAETDSERASSERDAEQLEQRIATLAAELQSIEQAGAELRERRSASGEQLARLERDCGRLEVELATLDEQLGVFDPGHAGQSIADQVEIEPGYELALAAALDNRLRAPIFSNLDSAREAAEQAPESGMRGLVAGGRAAERSSQPPLPSARRLLDRVTLRGEHAQLIESLLADTWIVERVGGFDSGFAGIAVTREGVAFNAGLRELRKLAATGASAGLDARRRRSDAEQSLRDAREQLVRANADADAALQQQREAETRRDSIEVELRELRRRREELLETARRAAWLIEQRRQHGGGPDDARRAELSGEISAERRMVDRLDHELAERTRQRQHLEALIAHDQMLVPVAQRVIAALETALTATGEKRDELQAKLDQDEAVVEQVSAKLRELAQSEYDLQAKLREASESHTQCEVSVAQTRDREQTCAADLAQIAERLGLELEAAEQPLDDEQRAEVTAKLERLERRRERIGPINPLAEQEYKQAIEHVEELETQRKDLEAALNELQSLIRETDRRIREAFEETFEAAARNFEEVIEQLFPGGRGRLRRVSPQKPKVVLGGGSDEEAGAGGDVAEAQAEQEARSEEQRQQQEGEGDQPSGAELAAKAAASAADETPGIEIEVTPAGKVPKRLSLLSGGEKSLVALAFMFAVFLARPCPFYILDEVEAALDDSNIDRFLDLVRRFADRAQFIVITHQRRTMEAADVIYGVSMASDGVSKVVSRRMGEDGAITEQALEAA